jgi:hypothetical protein
VEDGEGYPEYHDQSIVEPLLVVLAGLLDLLFDLAESIGNICFLWRLVNIRVDEAVD